MTFHILNPGNRRLDGGQPPKPQSVTTNWYGRAVNWLSNSAGGKLAQAAGWGFLCGLSVIGSVAAVSVGFGLVSSGAGAIATGVGIPLGAVSIVGGIGLAASSVFFMKVSHVCYNKASHCFSEYLESVQ